MATTMNLIAKQTVGAGGASSVTFSNIPDASKGYTDLKVVISVRTTNTLYGETIRIKPNGLSTNGSAIILRGYGSGTSSYTYSSVLATNNSLGNGATANTFASIEVYCPNYTSSNYKSFSADSVSENNDTNGRQELTASLWSSTAAITSLVFDNDASYGFTEYSTFYLYGISNSSTQNTTTPLASGGDVITTDGSYWYHAFKYSGSFTPLKNLTADVLVVAGGGGGGYNTGGGGGAGGLRALSTQALTSATNYTCTIGAGGVSGASNGNDRGGLGGNSSIAGTGLTTISASGGGGGGGASTKAGQAGGSGGGASRGGSGAASGGSGNAGSYSPVEGYKGGDTSNIGNGGNSGGGGGAGTAAANVSSSNSTAGGIGATSSLINAMALATVTGVLDSTNYYYAGGGGGGNYQGSAGAGGIGGGGAGAPDGSAGSAGTANTGGGGGGGNNNNSPSGAANGYQGGSGIIIVRYAV
jgi:hypothetical protein